MSVRAQFGLLLVVWFVASSTSAQHASPPSDDAIRAMLATRVDAEHRSVGLVVGIVDPSGGRLIAHGAFGVNDPRPVDGDTFFEIGSVTKVFTSLLLAEMASRGEVRFDDPVGKYLPDTVRMPQFEGRQISLQDLSTHTSALPRLPTNLLISRPDNPYADYSAARLYEFLSSYALTRAIGSQYEYSNLGAGLLGHALSLRAGSDYESAIQTRILARLKMRDTAIGLSLAARTRLAQGHSHLGVPAGNWDLAALAGAGGLKSTTNDLMKLLAAFAGIGERSLEAPMALMLSVVRAGAVPGTSAALGWHITTLEGTEIVWHGGSTGGYSAFIGYVPGRRTGVAVLSNMASASGAGVDDIGLHLLDGRIPLTRPPATRVKVTVPAATLQRYAGRYELAPGFVVTVIHEEGRLFVQPSGQPRHEIFAESERAFFATIADAQFSFEVDATGKVTAMVLHQGGKSILGKRLSDSAAAGPAVQRTQIEVSPQMLEPFVGRYQLNVAISITVTREDARLFAQPSGQARFELFAETPERFFAKVGGIEIAFARDEQGRVSVLTIRQNGTAFVLKRVE